MRNGRERCRWQGALISLLVLAWLRSAAPVLAQEPTTILTVEEKDIRNAAISPDGKKLALYSGQGLRILSVPTGKFLHAPKLEIPVLWNALELLFSPDSKQLAFAGFRLSGDFGLYLMEVESGKVRTLDKRLGEVCAWTFSSDSKQLIAFIHHDFHFFDVKSGDKTSPDLLVRGVKPNTIAVSPDGKFATITAGGLLSVLSDGKTLLSVSWSDKTIQRWDAKTGKQRGQVMVPGLAVFASQDKDKEPAEFRTDFCLSPDGRRLAAVSHKSKPTTERFLRVFDTQSGKTLAMVCETCEKGKLKGLGILFSVKGVTFSPDCQIVYYVLATGNANKLAPCVVRSIALGPAGVKEK